MKSKTLVASLITGGIIILIAAFKWNFPEFLTILLIFLLEIIIYIFFSLLAIWTIIYGFRNLHHSKLKALSPLAVNLLTLAIVIFIPFTSIQIHSNFNTKLKQRNEIINMVEGKEFKIENTVNNNQTINLPSNYQHASSNQKIRVIQNDDSTKVFFFTFTGILDNFSGFIYTSDDSHPIQGEFACDYIQLEKLGKFWYWVACN